MINSNNFSGQKFTLSPESSVLKSKSPRNPRSLGKILIACTIIVLIIIISGVEYLHFSTHKLNKTNHTTTKSIPPTSSSNSSSSNTQYFSNGTDLNLSFDYPSNWSVTPPSNNNSSDQTITLTSPLLSIPNAANASVTGKIVVEVRPQTATLNELNANSPVTAIASTQIGYTNPTSTQFQYPYLSYIHFTDGSGVGGAFEEVMITGSQAFTPGTAFSTGYLNGVDPIISASFYQCTTQSCSGSGQIPLSITSSIWQNSLIFQQVLSILESFKLN